MTVLACVSIARATTASNLNSFEGREEPTVIYHPGTSTFTDDTFTNITDVGNATVRFSLRYQSPDWWDGDRNTTNDDRQRAEVKGLGVHQENNQTFEYRTTWRTNPEFVGANRFCHIFQLKATDGDDGAPLVTLSLSQGTSTGTIRLWSGAAANSTTVRSFSWDPGEWQTAIIRIKTSPFTDGSVLASINGDTFTGKTNLAVYRPDSTDYRPKWGLYRGTSDQIHLGTDWVEHRNLAAVALVPEPAAGLIMIGAIAPALLRRRRR
jgi:hypothetical protein